ncbi:MAG: hypothetical protein LBK01_09060 [Burkholderiaceae bacterium]|jgi:hypothetical protein|nr:hypothetical protein [Burkholderiaceae bacterium]
MARKQISVTIEKEGRDKGKTFQIEEMSADSAERWALRALFAAMNAGVQMSDDMTDSGMAGIASLGWETLCRVPYEVAEPLLDELMECVKMATPSMVRNLVESDIEEVSTRLKLKMDVFKLHVESFTGGAD